MIKRCLCSFSFGIFTLTAAASAEGLSTVSVVIPERLIALTLGATPKIYIDGVISKETVLQLSSIVRQNQIVAATVYLNSPGGSLLSGIELGKTIRRFGFDTSLGRKPKTASDEAGEGGCHSACVFAYVGGGYRYSNGNFQIGVHRFSTAAPLSTDLEMAQILSAAITNHLNGMGVDVALFERMVQAPSDGIIILTKSELKNMGVVNDGVLPSVWSLVNTGGIVYLKGEQETDRGIGKFILNCVDGTIFGAAFYEGGGNADTIAATQRYSLRIDDQFLPISIRGPVKSKNGFVSAQFFLSTSQLRAIISAQNVGFAFHPPNPDLYFGYTVNLSDRGKKITDFIKYCSTQKKP